MLPLAESPLLLWLLSVAVGTPLGSTLAVTSASSPSSLGASVQAQTHELTRLINNVSTRIGHLRLTGSTIVARAHNSRHILPHRQCVTLSLDVRLRLDL